MQKSCKIVKLIDEENLTPSTENNGKNINLKSQIFLN